MSLFLKIVNVVCPVLLLIVFGLVLGRLDILGDEFVTSVNKAIFTVFMPVNIFNNIYGARDFNILDPIVLLLVFVLISVVIFITGLLLGRMGFDNEEKAVTINGVMRSNIIIFGLALAQNYFDSYQVGIVTMYIVLISVLRDIYSIFIYEYYLQTGEGIDILGFLKSVVSSPILIAAVVGILFAVLEIGVIDVLKTPMEQIGSLTAPLGLMTVGAALKVESSGSDDRILAIGVILKSVIIPVIALTLGVLIGFTGPELFVVMILFATPIAVSSYPMAVKYTDKGDLAAKLVVYSTVFNGFTIFGSMLVLSGLGLF